MQSKNVMSENCFTEKFMLTKNNMPWKIGRKLQKISRNFRIADNLLNQIFVSCQNTFFNFRTSEIKNADNAFFCTFPRSWNSF